MDFGAKAGDKSDRDLKQQSRPCDLSRSLSLEVILNLKSPSCKRFLLMPLHPTYMHLRIELLGGGGGGVGPRHVVVGGHVAVAVGCVPAVGAGGPGQGGPK